MIDVLISTFGDRIGGVLRIPLPYRDGINYIITHQNPTPLSNEVLNFIESRCDVFYFTLNGKGLSKNRNNSIHKSRSKYIYFCDDDVVLSECIFDVIISSFQKYDVDAISFKVRTHELKPFKNYKKKVFKHTILSVLKISSIELVCKRSSIIDSKILFDEEFGLGSKYVASEENIFVSDLVKSGMVVFFVPESIVYHPAESSGKNWTSIDLVYSKGAFFKRVFGPYIGLLFIFLFAIKKYKNYKNKISFINFIRQSLLGYKEYN